VSVLMRATEIEGRPVVTLAGQKDGLLGDPAAPLVLEFSEPIDPASLAIKVARYKTDSEGNLGDEDSDESTQLDWFFHREKGDEEGGTSQLDAAHRSLRITLEAPLPVGPRLVIVIEPGLASPTGDDATHTRKRILFGYGFDLACTEPTTAVPSGTYFFLADVTDPLPTQVQLFAVLRVDPQTGAVVGQFTNADRNPDPNRCGLACKSTDACRTAPDPACVIPSTKAASVDEYGDFVPNAGPTSGYSFTDIGCVQEQSDGSGVLVLAPVDVEVTSPAVTLRNVHLVASFARDAAGELVATGSFSADAVLLGMTPSGTAKGDLTARQIPDGKAPPGIPEPPETIPGNQEQP